MDAREFLDRIDDQLTNDKTASVAQADVIYRLALIARRALSTLAVISCHPSYEPGKRAKDALVDADFVAARAGVHTDARQLRPGWAMIASWDPFPTKWRCTVDPLCENRPLWITAYQGACETHANQTNVFTHAPQL